MNLFSLNQLLTSNYFNVMEYLAAHLNYSNYILPTVTQFYRSVTSEQRFPGSGNNEQKDQFVCK